MKPENPEIFPREPLQHGDFTLRDYFAAKALLVMHMKAEEVSLLLENKEPNCKRVAEFCYSMADAMLKAREK